MCLVHLFALQIVYCRTQHIVGAEWMFSGQMNETWAGIGVMACEHSLRGCPSHLVVVGDCAEDSKRNFLEHVE